MTKFSRTGEELDILDDPYVSIFCIYPITTSGVLGSPITFTDSQGHTVCTMFQGAITNAASIGGASRVLVGGANDRFCGSIDSVNRWSFPAGGPSTHHNDDIAFPMGAAIRHK